MSRFTDEQIKSLSYTFTEAYDLAYYGTPEPIDDMDEEKHAAQEHEARLAGIRAVAEAAVAPYREVIASLEKQLKDLRRDLDAERAPTR